jgi:PKD repeat protein
MTLTVKDGWGKEATALTRTLVLTEPSDNDPPNALFTVSCTNLACQVINKTTDPDNDVVRYSWNFGDGSAPLTATQPQKVYAAAGTYTITLTATDGWNRTASYSQSVTVPTT